MNAKEVYELHLKWVAKQEADNQKKELDPNRIGKLRGGSVGCISHDGKTIYGTCPRRALARSWGYAGITEPHRHLMFRGGKANETALDSFFEEMLGEGVIIPEGSPDTVISYELPDKRVVEGSPDAKLTLGTTPILEYKRISAAWTARKVSIKKKPKKEHVIQASHYIAASKLQAGVLIYVQDVDFPCPGVGNMDTRTLWPESSEVVEYKDDYPHRVIPHISVFDIQFDNDFTVWIRHHSEEEFTKTDISAKGIFDWYQLTSKQESDKFLSNKPTRKSPFGDKGDNHGPCLYCELSDVCADKALKYDHFEKTVKSRINYEVLNEDK